MDFFRNLLTNGKATEYITLIGSFVAIIISVCSYRLSRKNLVLNSITTNRIKWISDVRESILKFLAEYIKKENSDRYVLEVTRAEIHLYLRDSPLYTGFLTHLTICTSNPFTEENYKTLILQSQDILNESWRRMKIEAGIRTKHDIRISERLKKDKTIRDEYDSKQSS